MNFKDPRKTASVSLRISATQYNQWYDQYVKDTDNLEGFTPSFSEWMRTCIDAYVEKQQE